MGHVSYMPHLWHTSQGEGAMKDEEKLAVLKVKLKRDLHKRLKVRAAEEETTMQAIIETLVSEWLDGDKPF